MTIKTTTLGGADWVDGEVLPASDQNDTIEASAKGGLLGEVKMFALSMTGCLSKATLQGYGWAVCDGTTPATQGISSPTIETTPDLQENFIRMSNDETSGSTGGSDTHNHQWFQSSGDDTWESDGVTTEGIVKQEAADPGANGWAVESQPDSYTKLSSTLPVYTEMVFFLKVKII